jgi:hypothetical protein
MPSAAQPRPKSLLVRDVDSLHSASEVLWNSEERHEDEGEMLFKNKHREIRKT